MMQKLNVLQMIKEQKQKEQRKHQAALCQIGQCKTQTGK
jgi:hypothetical protein